MKTLLARFLRNESGSAAVEYGLLACLIGAAILAGAAILGSNLNTMFVNLGTLQVEASADHGG
jgi:pilus assembly protein Flp/PilA